MAEQSKVSLKSHIKARQKLTKDLSQAMQTVNPTQSNSISFDLLGSFLHRIGIYSILYNPAYHIRITPEGRLTNAEMRYQNNQFKETLNREALFHLNFWYSINRFHKLTVDCELVLELVALLYDADRNNSEELLLSIEGNYIHN